MPGRSAISEPGLDDVHERALATVSARHHGGPLEVSLRDDGHGVDLDSLRRWPVERGLSTTEMLERPSEDGVSRSDSSGARC